MVKKIKQVRQKILDISRANYFDFCSDLLYIEAGLQKIAQSEVFVFGSKSKLSANTFWDCKQDSNVTNSGIYFVFLSKCSGYYDHGCMDLKIIFSKFRNLDNLHKYLHDSFGLITDNLIFMGRDRVYTDRDGLYTRILTFKDLSMDEIMRLKGIVDEHKFMRMPGTNNFYIVDKSVICRDLLNRDSIYNRVLSYLIGSDMRSYGSYSVKVIGRNTLSPVIYFGNKTTDIEMIKNRLLKYLPVDSIEIVEMDMQYYTFHYKISLKFTESIFMTIFHDLYIEGLNFDKVKGDFYIPEVI